MPSSTMVDGRGCCMDFAMLFFVNCADESDTETFGFNSLGN